MTLQNALTLYRRLNPKARRTNSTAIIHSGSHQTVWDCVCGSVHTESTRHRDQTKHVREWLANHSNCLIQWANEHK